MRRRVSLRKSHYIVCLMLCIIVSSLWLLNTPPDLVTPPAEFRISIIGSGGIQDSAGYTFTIVNGELPDGGFEKGLQNYAFQLDTVEAGAVRGTTLTAISHLVSGTTYTQNYILRRWNAKLGRQWSRAGEFTLGFATPVARVEGVTCSPNSRWIAFSTTSQQGTQSVFILDWSTKQKKLLAEFNVKTKLRLACTNTGDVYVQEYRDKDRPLRRPSPVTFYGSDGTTKNIGSYHQILTTKIGSFGILFEERPGGMAFIATSLDGPSFQQQRYRVQYQRAIMSLSGTAMSWEDVVCSDDGDLWGIVLYKPESGWPFYALEHSTLVVWSQGQEKPIYIKPHLDQEVASFSLLSIKRLGT